MRVRAAAPARLASTSVRRLIIMEKTSLKTALRLGRARVTCRGGRKPERSARPWTAEAGFGPRCRRSGSLARCTVWRCRSTAMALLGVKGRFSGELQGIRRSEGAHRHPVLAAEMDRADTWIGAVGADLVNQRRIRDRCREIGGIGLAGEEVLRAAADLRRRSQVIAVARRDRERRRRAWRRTLRSGRDTSTPP